MKGKAKNPKAIYILKEFGSRELGLKQGELAYIQSIYL